MDRFELYSIINRSFNIPEIQELSFKLGVDYDELAGEVKSQKVIELVGYAERRGGLERLEQFVRIVRPNSFSEQIRPAIYKSTLSFPFDYVRQGLAAISELASPTIWRQLEITNPLRHGGWMGTESGTLIEIFYALFSPVVAYNLCRIEFERNFAMLDWRTRFQFLLLDFVGLAILHDGKIAGLDPQINYTPRVSGWRWQREDNPQKYWWQGLSNERYENAIDAFCILEGNSEKRIMSLNEFTNYYKGLFSSQNTAAQQTLGLAANPLYGFTPRTRPVYWRLLVIQSRLYHAILASLSESLKRPETIPDLKAIFSIVDSTQFPFGDVAPEFEAYETIETTFNATTQFLEYVVIPQTILNLKASQFHAQ